MSMGANSATKLHKIINNLQYIAAIELMNAAQAIDFRKPLKPSPYNQEVLKAYREKVPFVEDDVVMKDYIHDSLEFLANYNITIPHDA